MKKKKLTTKNLEQIKAATSTTPTNSVLLELLNEINKKLDKLLFTQEIVDRLINCEEARSNGSVPITVKHSENKVNFDEIMEAKDFEDLCKSEFFEKPKTKKTIRRR